MQEDKNHISFTAEDIRKYHEGKLTPAEMHALEKASLEDPFLADALEGYAVDEVQVPADIDELKQRLQDRIAEKKVIPMAVPSRTFNWLRAAAMIVAICGAGVLVYNFGFNSKEKQSIAQQKEFEKEIPATKAVTADSFKPQANVADTEQAAAKTPSKKSSETVPAETKSSKVEAANIQHETLARKDKKESLVSSQPVAKAVTPPAGNVAEFEKALSGRIPGVDVSRTKADDSRARLLDTTSNTADKFIATETVKNDNRATNYYSTEAKQNNSNQGLLKTRREQSLKQSPNIFRGKVTDAQNNPLPFANITNSHDNVGTYADGQGNFVLTSPDSTMDVQVKSLGFENNNVQLQNGLTLNRVTLKDDNSIAAIVLSNKKVNAKLKENNMVLEEPEPADGWTKYDAYLANNLNLPDDYKGGQKQGGEVELSFEVNQLGEPINIKVEKSLCEVCDKEAIRLLKEGPKWKRKAKKGKRTSITIPF